jgi:hypothetical protein
VKLTNSTSISKTTVSKLTSASLTTGLCVRAIGTTRLNWHGHGDEPDHYRGPPSSTGSCTTAAVGTGTPPGNTAK